MLPGNIIGRERKKLDRKRERQRERERERVREIKKGRKKHSNLLSTFKGNEVL